MANQVLKDARLWIGGYNFSGDVNALVLEYLAEQQDDTVILDTARSRLPGLKASVLQCDGFVNQGTGEIDETLHDNIALADVPVTACAIPGAVEGDRSFSFLASVADYQRQAPVGEMFRFSAGAEGRGVPLVRGQLLNTLARTTTGNGVGWQLGALSASQRLYAALHVLAVSGGTPSLTAAVQSSSTQGGAYTSRLTFGAKTGVSYEWANYAGPQTDTWWRASWTISGSTPSFLFIVAAGIL